MEKWVSTEQAFQKIRQFCAYQERCHREVKEKLAEWGVPAPDREAITASLIEEDYLNEERFASVYAGGKFRMKQWGKMKIRHELQKKQVSEYCIRKALDEIEEEDYLSTFMKLFTEKLHSLRSEKQVQLRKRKTLDYLTQKGYERDLIYAQLSKY